MTTSFEFQRTALAMATDWRWPPERDATGWRMERTVGTSRSTSARARAAPCDLLSPCRLSSGRAEPLVAGSASRATGLFDSGGGAGALRLGDADVGRLDGAVLDHRRRQVLGRDPG